MGHRLSKWYALPFISLVGTLLVVACGGMDQTVVEFEEATEEFYEEQYDPAPETEPTEKPKPTAMARPTPPPATSLPPTTTVAERLSAIDEVLEDTMEGALAYDAPTTMDLNDVEEVRLLLDLEQSPEQLVAVLEAEHDEQAATVRQMEGATINITDQMQAELVSRDPDALDIEPLRDQMQFIGTGEPTEWKWLLKPRREGQHSLYLVVSRLVRYGGDQSWRLVEEYETNLDVTVTPVNKLANYVRTIVDKYLIQLILMPVIVGLVLKLIDLFLARRSAG